VIEIINVFASVKPGGAMATQKKSNIISRKLSSRQAKRVARKLQLVVVDPRKSLKPLSLKSTATGKGSVVFRASRVLNSLAGVAKS